MRHSVVAAGLLTLTSAVLADAPAPPLPPEVPFALALAGVPGMPGEDVLGFVSSEIGGRGLVKGAPYSATAVSETRQTLADGNRIVNSRTTRLFRDGQGRTRQEQARGVVFINDVVAGKRLLLNTERRTARELPRRAHIDAPAVPPVPPVPPTNMSGEEAKSWAESMRQWGRDFSARMRGEHATPERSVDVVVRREDGGADVAERVEVVRLADGPWAGMPMPPPMPPLITPTGAGTKTSLGSRDFDGVRADGTRTTWTIPARRIGNEKPIDVVSERWYAPELMLVVYSRFADPRSGERIYRLENIKRTEPPAELFQAPPDYETASRPPRPEKK
jgi:hypothetical protein